MGGAPKSPRTKRTPAAGRPAIPLASASEPLVIAPVAPPAASARPGSGITAGPIDQPVTGAPTAPATAAPLPTRPTGRALVRQDLGVVARVVAWLGRLLPRRRKAALPRARTRLERSAAPGTGAAPDPAPAPASPAGQPETTAELTRRMLLQLSAENERLRREVDALRSRAERAALTRQT
ncbi:hypothetical protein ACFOON_02895 [Novosphingobium piscinae]|uniref:Uncharacterized protein n=1 Tax=Novosphingobium piscinae TaxID=1507448 RepID=A0A7X1G0P2_9SPHN|nr:hypothetical protein [Novosphingobium piscinae]MBC2670478.1 hypothetical protein [Novosphingobium piscinae]